MLTETARIVSVDGEFAWVSTQRKTSCDSCSVNHACGTGVLSKMFARRPHHLRAINRIGAREGEQVLVAMAESTLLKSSLGAYGLPIVLMMIGAVVGEWLHRLVAPGPNEGGAILGAVFGLGFGLWGLRRFNRNVAADERYQPCIVSRVQ